MKVYFSATPTGIKEYGHLYKRIAQHVEKLGHKHTSQWLLDFQNTFFNLPRAEWPKHYKDITQKISKADVAIWDITMSSTSCGQGVQFALFQKKPVIVLQYNQARKNIFLEGAGDVESKLLMVEYTDKDLEQKLEVALDYVEDWLETRFTMILDGETRRILDSVSESGKTRSDYIRELIKKDFEEGSK